MCSSLQARSAKTMRRRVHAAPLGLAAQVGLRRAVRFQQPEHAALDLAQDAHPLLEHLRRDLLSFVEAAEHEPILGQAAARSARRLGGRHVPPVVALVAVRQDGELLGGRVPQRAAGDERIDDDVVHRLDRRCPGISEIVHLNGRNPMQEDARTGIPRVTHEIHGDIDLHVAHRSNDGIRGAARARRRSGRRPRTMRCRSSLLSSSPKETPTISKRSRSCPSISPAMSQVVGCRRKSALT